MRPHVSVLRTRSQRSNTEDNTVGAVTAPAEQYRYDR